MGDTGLFHPRAQPQRTRLLFVGDKAFAAGSQGRAEELEAFCPWQGPREPWWVHRSPRRNRELWFSSVSPANSVPGDSAADGGRGPFLARSLRFPTCANAFCSH